MLGSCVWGLVLLQKRNRLTAGSWPTFTAEEVELTHRELHLTYQHRGSATQMDCAFQSAKWSWSSCMGTGFVPAAIHKNQTRSILNYQGLSVIDNTLYVRWSLHGFQCNIHSLVTKFCFPFLISFKQFQLHFCLGPRKLIRCSKVKILFITKKALLYSHFQSKTVFISIMFSACLEVWCVIDSCTSQVMQMEEMLPFLGAISSSFSIKPFSHHAEHHQSITNIQKNASLPIFAIKNPQLTNRKM